ncbi:MAG: hypothetical protein V7603_319 [Micromonosporaceae bacterium]
MSDGYPDIGPGGCGTWSSFDVPAIWSMLAYEDGVLSVEQATAWNRTYDLLASHAKNLQTLRDSLVERWPPEHNEASAVFLEYLDKLIGSVNPASYASSSNAVVLSDLVDTLAEAKGKVAPLHEQWEAAAASGTADPKLQGELNARAAEIMSSTDVAVYQHGQRFVVPPEYEPPTPQFESWTPFQVDPTPSSSSGSAHYSAVRPLSSGSGQVLRPRVKTPVGEAPILSNESRLPLPAAFQVHPPVPPTFSDTPAGRVLAPGGIVGSLPRGDLAPRSKATTPATRPGSRRAVGYSTSEAANRTAKNGSSVAGMSTESGTGANPREGSLGGLFGGAGSPRTQRRERQGEPYMDWPVPDGVPPVLESPPEPQRHEPGPGVIGIDR